MFRFLWRLTKWSIAALLIGAVAMGIYYYNRINEEIRCHCESVIADHYRGLSVSVRSARLIEGQGIEVRGLTIAQPGADGPRGELAYIDEIVAHCDPTLQRLYHKQLEVSHVSVRRLKIRSTRLPDGAWSGWSLLPPPKFGDRPPIVTIDDATIELFDPQNNPASTYTLRDANFKLTPRRDLAADPAANNGDAPTPVAVEGTFSGDHFQSARIDGFIDPAQSKWVVKGAIERLNVSPEWRQSLPGNVAPALGVLGTLRANSTFEFHLANPRRPSELPQFVVTGRIADGRMEDDRLPYPLTGVRADVRLDNAGVRIDNLKARSGPSSVEVSCRLDGYRPDSPMVLSASVRRWTLDDELIDLLPAEFRPAWDRFQPSGLIDADLTLRYDGRTWRPDLSVQCLDVAFAYEKFPYRLQQGTGWIRAQDQLVSFELRAMAGQQPVRISGRLDQPGPDCTGVVDLASEGPIPLDDRLIAAMDEKAQRIVRAFRARGAITFTGRIQRDSLRQDAPHKHFDIRLHDLSIKHERFPYPLDHITGTLELRNERWTFRDLRGRNDSGLVTCEGGWSKTGEQGLFWLDFTGADVPLENELRDALKPGVQKLWARLQPRGTIDQLEARFRLHTPEMRTSLEVDVQKWPAAQNVEGRAVSIEPTFFPYRLEELTGTLHFGDGKLTVENLRARHAQASLSTNLSARLHTDGSWQARLEPFIVDRLLTNRELIAALPPRFGQAVSQMNLGGPIGINGSLAVSSSGRSSDRLQSQWQLRFDVEDGSLNCGSPIEHVFGGLQLTGWSDGQSFRSSGQLAVDSAMFKNVQFTQVRGPVWIDQSQILLGSWAQHGVPGQAPKPVTAAALGGSVSGDLQLSLTDAHPFDLNVRLADGDLADVLRCSANIDRPITGRVYSTLRLSGNRNGVHTHRGTGAVRLRNANIYELPLMVALLKIPRLQPADRTAFTTSDIDYRVHGEHIYIDRINFDGDAVSLRGNGEVSRDRRINLNFYTIVGRHEVPLPIIQPLLGEAARQFMMIHVTGTLDKPVTTPEMLPGLNETLQQLFPEELTGQPNSARPPPSVPHQAGPSRRGY